MRELKSSQLFLLLLWVPLFFSGCAPQLSDGLSSISTATALPQPAAVPVPAVGADFIAGEISGRPTDTSITINLIPARELNFYYEYGVVDGGDIQQTPLQAGQAGVRVETVIGGLESDTDYFYRLRYENFIGVEHTFATQRAQGSPFIFAIQGDSHPERVRKQFDAELYTRTLLNAAADQPDFFITLGDDFSVDALRSVNAETVQNVYLNQRPWLGLVDAPIFLVNGNHEQAALVNLDGTADNVAVWAQTARNSIYPQPAPDAFYTGDSEPVEFIGALRDYYAFTWGDALFVVIDPYWHSSEAVDNTFGGDRESDAEAKKNRNLWDVTLGDTQYQWLKETLESSSARYKFVFTHHVLGTGRGGVELAGRYEWGDAANLAAYRPGWEKTIHQLLVDNQVTIFFQGHDHLFAQQELDGVIYQTLPSPGDPNEGLDNAKAYLSGTVLPSSGYLRVTVSPDGVTVDYIRTFLPGAEPEGHRNGETAYSYTVGKDSQISSTEPAALPVDSVEPAESFSPVDLILGRPTDRSVTASVWARHGGEGCVVWDQESETGSAARVCEALSAEQPVEMVLAELQPDSAYHYQLLYRAVETAAFSVAGEGIFHTQRAPTEPFTFTLQADSHLDGNTSTAGYLQTLLAIAAERPDFHIDLGDTFMTDKYQPYTDAADQYLTQRAYLSQVGETAPLFLVLGNHDGERGGRSGTLPATMAEWSTQWRQEYFPNPLPDGFYSGNVESDAGGRLLQNYYAWEWGNALFVALDPYRFTLGQGNGSDNWKATLGEVQYQWLKRVLENSSADFKFILIHQLVGGVGDGGRGGVEAAGFFEWGGLNDDGSWGFDEQRPEWEQPIHALLVENQVTAVFHGHDHLFARQTLDGIVYQAVPQPAAIQPDTSRLAEEYGYSSGELQDGAGYLRVSVFPTSVVVAFVRTDLSNFSEQEVSSTYILEPTERH